MVYEDGWAVWVTVISWHAAALYSPLCLLWTSCWGWEHLPPSEKKICVCFCRTFSITRWGQGQKFRELTFKLPTNCWYDLLFPENGERKDKWTHSSLYRLLFLLLSECKYHKTRTCSSFTLLNLLLKEVIWLLPFVQNIQATVDELNKP